MENAFRQIAKTFEDEADAHPKDAAHFFSRKAHFLERAIQAYRRVPNADSEREQLHKELLQCQKGAVGELQSFSHEIDVTDAVKSSRNAIKDQPIDEALRLLAWCGSSPNSAAMRDEAEQMIDKYVLSSIFPATTLGPMGKVVAKQEVMSRKSGDDRESQILLKMFWLAGLQRRLVVASVIDPMRRQLMQDHSLSYYDLVPFLDYNPLIPPSRAAIFAIGLSAGFEGNFLEATHILIPQLENAIRYALTMKGEVTSSLDGEGIQKEHDLNRLLYEPTISKLFSDDIVFDLRGLLVEQCAVNFRNRIAHGMVEFAEFHSETAIYVWWLILHICALGSSAANESLKKQS